MYLGVSLKHWGLRLHPSNGTGPEFWFESNGRQFWIEAVAPGPGTGADRVTEVEMGVVYTVPTEKILLRFANAVSEKCKRYQAALQSGIVASTSGYILAINSRRIPHALYGNTLPYFTGAATVRASHPAPLHID